MNSLEIKHHVSNDHLTSKLFGGVISADDLKDVAKGKLYVINDQPKTLPGRHWMGLYIDISSNTVEFWDSTGNKPEYYGEYFEDFFKNTKYVYNTRRLQGQENTCGEFSLYFLYHRSRGYNMEQIINSLTLDPACNDIIVVNFVKNCMSKY